MWMLTVGPISSDGRWNDVSNDRCQLRTRLGRRLARSLNDFVEYTQTRLDLIAHARNCFASLPDQQEQLDHDRQGDTQSKGRQHQAQRFCSVEHPRDGAREMRNAKALVFRIAR